MEDEDSLGSEFWEGVEEAEAFGREFSGGEFDEDWDSAERGLSSDEDFDAVASTSSQGRAGRGRGRGRGRNPTGNPNRVIQCHVCHSYMRTMEGYKKHLKTHLAEELYKLAPGYNAVHAHCRTATKAVLSGYSSSHLLKSEFAAPIVEVSKKLLLKSEEVLHVFVDFIIDSLWNCVPDPTCSKLLDFHSNFEKSVKQQVLQNAEHRNMGVNILKEALSISAEGKVLKYLVGDLVLKMSSEVQVFYLKCIREPHAALLYGGRGPVEADRDNPQDRNLQAAVYYIAGSTVLSVLKKGSKATHNTSWKKIISCISAKVIIGEEGIAPNQDITHWLECRDRGGLIHVTEPFWAFLMALSGVFKKLEEPNGSVLHNKVLTFVHDDNSICCLWSDIVSDILNKEESDLFLKEVCLSFGSTWGKGVALRRKNALSGLEKDKAPLRSSLVPH